MAIHFRKYGKNERSSFGYWFWHWAAYNYVAWKLGVWRPKWLLHDIEKPWLKLIWGDYKRVQRYHRHHSKHHPQYGRRYGLNKVDWLGTVIDWESCHYTKEAQQRTAREEARWVVENADYGFTKEERDAVKTNVFPILDHLGL